MHILLNILCYVHVMAQCMKYKMQYALYSEGEQNGCQVSSCCVCPLQWSELRLTSYPSLRSLLVLGKSPKSFSFCGYFRPCSIAVKSETEQIHMQAS